MEGGFGWKFLPKADTGSVFLAASSIVKLYACGSGTGPGSVAFDFSLVIALDLTGSNVIPYTLFML